MKSRAVCIAILALLAAVSQVASSREPAQVTGRSSIGINGGACEFATLKQAIQAASAGDTIYIQPSTRTELIGKIGISLTFVPAQAAPPTLSGCEQELLSATSGTVIIDGGGASDDARGGMAEIRDGADVTFRHMWLRNANATNGGILAVTGTGRLTLDDVLVTDGTASRSGGNIYVSSAGSSPGLLQLINDTSVYRGAASDGGAVALLNAQFIIDDGNVGVSSNNGFSTASNDGGGIHADSSMITMNSSQSRVIWNESGRYGGGLYAIDSTIDIDQSVLSNNTAMTSGGGMYLSGGSLILRGATMESNSATVSATNQGGGALYFGGDAFAQIRDTDFIANIAQNAGGAIMSSQGTLLQILENSSFVGNTAFFGGAINTQGELLLGNVLIDGNSATQSGGGVYCFTCAKLTINDSSVIRGNSAKSGGGVNVFGTADTVVNIRRTTFSQNMSTSLDSGFGNGGGINMTRGVLDISDSRFEQNSAAQNGGGLFAKGTADDPLAIALDEVEFTANVTTGSTTNQGGAGAVFERADPLELVDSLFELNGSHNIGGAAMIIDSDNVHISNAMFRQNTGSVGGGLYSLRSDLLVDKQSLFEANVATLSGGGMYATGSNVNTLLRNVDVAGNQATFGAGMYLSSNHYELLNVHISSNVAETNGGGVLINNSIGRISSEIGQSAGRCDPFELPGNRYCTEISNNSAGEFGGGIQFSGSSTVNIGDTQLQMLAITDNQAPLGGSAIHAEAGEASTLSLQNVLVANNGNPIDESSVIEVVNEGQLILDSVTVAGNFGSPMWAVDSLSGLQIDRSILHANSIGPRVANGISFQRFCNNAQATSGSSQSMGGSLGDPDFTLTARGDYRLSASSVSVDACPNGPIFDLDGLVRPDNGGSFDQGAFERDGVQPSADTIFSDGFED